MVTGGAGFIGSHLVDHLINLGAEVSIIDNLSTGRVENLNPKAKFIKGDMRDKELLRDVLRNKELVFHFAAMVSIEESFSNPQKCFEINNLGFLNILELAVENRVKKVIFASSCAVYGSVESEISENMALNPSNFYALSKYDGECYLRYFSNRIEYSILRFFNVYGLRQNADSEYAPVIPIFIKRALANQDLIIYGDGTQTRDFIYVSDVANACVKAQFNPNGIFNIGSGKEISILELAQKVIYLTNSKSKITFTLERSGDIKRSFANISNAVKNLGWKREISLEEGLKKMEAWIRDLAKL
ncbi:MAG: NAD-dependent epimerase/dehydratase family protein [bacterium]